MLITNFYFWMILSSLVGLYLLDTATNLLNLKSLRRELPEEFKGIYDETDYRRLLDYTATTTRFEISASTFNLGLLLTFWFCGGYDFFDQLVRSLGLRATASGLLFIGALWIGHWLLNLPFELYDNFSIEERFGFNKMTLRTFLADQFKSLLLAGIIGGSVLAIVLKLFQHGGPAMWLDAWAISSALLLVFAFIAPTVILPLFNKFTPLEDGELKDAIFNYSRAQNFPISGCFVMDGSKRSTKANAFFTGFGKTKKIVLFDTLIASHTVDELVAVLAHEIGHYKLRHVPQHLVGAIANIGVFFFLAAQFIHARGLFDAFGVHTMSVYVGLALFLVFYNPLSRLLSTVRGFQSRRHEFQADKFASETTHHPQAMIDALKKLSKSNLSNLTPHPLYVALYHSHPPVLQRIASIQAGG